MACSYFAFYKKATRIKFLLAALVVACMAYLAFYFSSNSYSDYFYSAFSLGDTSYFFSAWFASVFLFFKNGLFGVGLGGFEAQLYSVQSFDFPLIISNPSNFYLLLLSELGILGAVLLAKPLFLLLKEKHQQLKVIPRFEIIERRPCVPMKRFLFSIFMSITITFLLSSLFYSVIIIPFFVCIFAVCVAALHLKSVLIRSKFYEMLMNYLKNL